jgi:hypothetical protein
MFLMKNTRPGKTRMTCLSPVRSDITGSFTGFFGEVLQSENSQVNPKESRKQLEFLPRVPISKV